jgi:hypothetical protein
MLHQKSLFDTFITYRSKLQPYPDASKISSWFFKVVIIRGLALDTATVSGFLSMLRSFLAHS